MQILSQLFTRNAIGGSVYRTTSRPLLKPRAAAVVLCATNYANYATISQNAPLAEKLKVNGDRLWEDIHYTAQWSDPCPGGLSRLCGTDHDKNARDWFRDQVLALGADYKVILALE